MTSSSSTPPSQLPLAETAFLLDFDGTLVDIAPSPEAVVVPDTLRDTLKRLRAQCGDALAVVSGRPVEQIDHFLGDIPFAVAGEHGVAVRHRPGGPIIRAVLPEVPAAWHEAAKEIAASWPGVLIERKGAGFVIHYRGAPEAGEQIGATVAAWFEGGDHGFHAQPAKMAWEIRPKGIDKGYAVKMLMESSPFSGRKPVFVGDDVTDEDGIAEAKQLGGMGWRIPDDFATPETFRAWLGTIAAKGEH